MLRTRTKDHLVVDHRGHPTPFEVEPPPGNPITATSIRDPVDWYLSMWSHFGQEGKTIEPNRGDTWFNRSVRPRIVEWATDLTPDEFALKVLDEMPGLYRTLVGRYSERVDFILDQRRLTRDLYRVLRFAGVGSRSEFAFSTVERTKISRRSGATFSPRVHSLIMERDSLDEVVLRSKFLNQGGEE